MRASVSVIPRANMKEASPTTKPRTAKVNAVTPASASARSSRILVIHRLKPWCEKTWSTDDRKHMHASRNNKHDDAEPVTERIHAGGTDCMMMLPRAPVAPP